MGPNAFRALPLLAAVIVVLCLAALTPELCFAGVGAEKSKPDNSAVSFTSASVTAVFDDHFYVQDAVPGSGIRVSIPDVTGVFAGSSVSFTGVIGTTTQMERVVAASGVQNTGASAARPILVRCSQVGGQDWQYFGNGSGQKGVVGGKGLNNLGLHVKVSGWVTYAAPGAFYIDDGSGADDGSGHPGLRVESNLLPTQGMFVHADGIASVRLAGSDLRPILKLSATSVVTLEGGHMSGKVGVWSSQITPVNVQSPHPTVDDFDQSYPLNAPAGAFRSRVHFAAMELDALDSLYVLDGDGYVEKEYNYFEYSFPMYDLWGPWVNGDHMTIRLITEYSYFLFGRYGFWIDAVESVRFDGLNGVTLTLEPGNRVLTTGPDGNYAFGALSEGMYTITPSKPGYSFNPPSLEMPLGEGDVVQYLDFYASPE